MRRQEEGWRREGRRGINFKGLWRGNSGEEEEHEKGGLGLFGQTYRVSAMLTFNPSEFSTIRLQYDYTDPDFTANQHALFLQFQYSLGAHGAHPF